MKTLKKTRNIAEKEAEKLPFFDLVNGLISYLPERSQEILSKRFGFYGEKPQTLDKIGKDYNITRERIRQIISDAVKKISKKETNQEFANIEEKISFTIKENNGIIRQDKAVEKLAKNLGAKEENALKFFVSNLSKIESVEIKDLIEKCWVISVSILEKVKETEKAAEEILTKEGKPLKREELAERIQKSISSLTKEEIISFLDTLYQIKKNTFGYWGLKIWPEISPRGVKDKIYLVLKEKNEPLHFVEVANLIDEHGLSKKKAHPQTVHNELIKDERFVLIGRGIYALSDWGYKKGTVREAIAEIIKNRGPLERKHILDEVAKIRKVKKSTIMINLNDDKFFAKIGNKYTVKK